MSSVLDELLGRVDAVSASGARPVVIFDLDDTLLSTSGRHLRILREYVAGKSRSLRGAADPGFPAVWALAQAEAAHLRYSIVDTARSVGVTSPDILEDLRSFWFERFFRNEYLREDAPLPGAPEYCGELARRGARLTYVTGRDEGMREGTEYALTRHGFPMPDGEGVRLVLKPRFDLPDFEFKAEASRRCSELGEVVGVFENEPAHVNLLREMFPSALAVLLETKHSGKPVTLHPAAARIGDFSRREKIYA